MLICCRDRGIEAGAMSLLLASSVLPYASSFFFSTSSSFSSNTPRLFRFPLLCNALFTSYFLSTRTSYGPLGAFQRIFSFTTLTLQNHSKTLIFNQCSDTISSSQSLLQFHSFFHGKSKETWCINQRDAQGTTFMSLEG